MAFLIRCPTDASSEDGASAGGLIVLQKLALLVCSSLLVLLVGEALLRWLDLAPSRDVYSVTAEQFRSIPGIYAPGQDFISREMPALPHHVTINDLGYRGRGFPILKPRDEVRVLMAGDSMTYGDFVDNDDTLPSQLEALLQETCPNARVINAGLRGGTIVGEAALVERGLELNPDLVVLVFHENDVTDLSDPLWPQLEENRRLKSRFPLRMVYPILRETAVWNLALRVAARLRAERTAQIEPGRRDERGAGDRVVLDALKEQYADHLHKLHRLLADRGTRFVFVTFPGHQAFDGAEFQAGLVEWAYQTARLQDIPSFNLLSSMRDSGESKTALYLLPHDGHPSARGHAVAARALHGWLLELEALRDRCRA